ncbi:MAG: PHP domain-containing protein [Candidatus Thorarchaeota archaeon]|nr:PHP domain-containing protein [Candidatus Thorarchaeota archaeon]
MYATHSDYHIHSEHSDGTDSIHNIVHRASVLKLKKIAITDHFWPSLGSQRGGQALIDRRRNEIEIARSEYPQLMVLNGTEVDIQSDGTLARVAGGLKQFELVIGSFHWVTNSTTWASTLKKALRDPQFHILGHWDGYLSSYRDEDSEAVVNLLAEAGVAIELSGRYVSEHPDFFELAMKAGCKFTLGSDSHSIETIGQLDFQKKLASDYDLHLIEFEELVKQTT